ncbi:MAG: adenylate/guanylate cyclase domain-containing protein [Candidatus Sericytochromatia bacterium]|nr:adenylate/guanylate cyclase domain-containing protein [Candidatus Sericytochromatia bacterium]
MALAWLLLALTGFPAKAQWAAYHALFEARGPLPQPEHVVVVAIDEASLAELGSWPVDRAIWGQLLDGLFGAGARVVGLDIAFVQPATNPAADRRFAQSLARWRGRVVLAANFQPGTVRQVESRQLILPTATLRAAAEVGVVDLPFDADGSIHRFPRLLLGVDPTGRDASAAYEGFALALARRFNPDLRLEGDDWLINYSGPPGHVRTLSLVSVLDALERRDGRLLGALRDRVVLVGASALRLQDQYPTPFSATLTGQGAETYMAGVEIHAQAVATLLRGDAVRPLPASLEAAALLSLGVLTGWLGVRLRPLPAALAGAAGVLGLCWASVGVFTAYHLWIDPVGPLLLVGLSFVVGLGFQYLFSEQRRRLTRQTFARYVDREIVEMLLAKPSLAPRLGGEQREVTVLFSDIRSFTSISEQRTPEQVVAFLNAYLTEMAAVIRAERGCIDKYIGDAILAVWGNVVPMPPEEAARRGVRAALGMLRRLEAKRMEWAEQGFPELAIGIGLNTGEAVVGNIGSPEKMEFGVIGDAVNVASRLEGLTKEHGALLVSARTRELLGEAFVCEPVGPIAVKGRVQAVEVWRVLREADHVIK